MSAAADIVVSQIEVNHDTDDSPVQWGLLLATVRGLVSGGTLDEAHGLRVLIGMLAMACSDAADAPPTTAFEANRLREAATALIQAKVALR